MSQHKDNDYNPESKDSGYVREEPSYMMFARANVRDGMATSPTVVRMLLERIDRLESTKDA